MAPLSSADKPGQKLGETQLPYWPEPFESLLACERAWVRRRRRRWARKGRRNRYVYNQTMWVSNDC